MLDSKLFSVSLLIHNMTGWSHIIHKIDDLMFEIIFLVTRFKDSDSVIILNSVIASKLITRQEISADRLRSQIAVYTVRCNFLFFHLRK